MASKEEIQKKNIEEANAALGEQLNIASSLSDVMKDIVSSSTRRTELDKASLGLVRESSAMVQKVNSEYENLNQVQKDITKQEKLQEKIKKQILAINGNLNETEKKSIDNYKKTSEGLSKANSLVKSLTDKQKQGLNITNDQVKRAKDLAARKEEELGIAGQQLSNQAEQVVVLEQSAIENEKIAAHLSEQERRQTNLVKSGGLIGDALSGAATIFNKMGMSKVGSVFGDASKRVKEMTYAATNGGKKVIGGFAKMRIAAKGFGMALKTALGPIALISMAVSAFQKMKEKAKKSADAIKGIEQASADMGRELGLSASKTAEVASQANKAAAGMGMTRKEAAAAAGSIYSSMDGAEKMTDKTMRSFMKLQKFAKMSGEDLKAIKNLSKLSGQEAGKTADEMAKQAQISIKNLKLNTSMKSLMQAVGKVSSNVKLAMGGSAKGITAAVAQAKKLGLEMSQVEGIASSLLNIEDSLQAEMEAELLTGKELNLEKARAAALNGDNVALMDALAEQGITQADYSAMNVIQQEALAKSLGMNRGQMADMLVTQKESTAENTDMVDMQKQGIEAMTGLVTAMERKNKMEEDSLVANEKSGRFYIMFEEAILRLQTALAPIMEEIMPIILESVVGIVEGFTSLLEDTGILDVVLQAIRVTIEAIKPVFTFIGNMIKSMVSGISQFLGYLFQTKETAIVALSTFGAIYAMQKRSLIQAKASKAIEVAKNVVLGAGKGIRAAQEAIKTKGILKSIGGLAINAAKAVAGIPFVGPVLAAGAAVAAYQLGKSYLKGDDVFSPGGGGGYGNRTLMGPEGAIALNDKDDIIAGTDLFNKGNSGGGGGNNSAELGRIANLLEQLLNKEGGVYIDGNKVGGTIALTNYEQQ
jgi:hypothetical protein